MKKRNIFIIAMMLGAIIIPSFAYEYNNGVRCDKIYVPFVGSFYKCTDGRAYTTYLQMNDYYTTVINPIMEETSPEYTYIIGENSETLTGR